MSDQNSPQDMQPPVEILGRPPYPLPDLSFLDKEFAKNNGLLHEPLPTESSNPDEIAHD
jgi:hypothetical protein